MYVIYDNTEEYFDHTIIKNNSKKMIFTFVCILPQLESFCKTFLKVSKINDNKKPFR